jgi:hypothetical protein
MLIDTKQISDAIVVFGAIETTDCPMFDPAWPLAAPARQRMFEPGFKSGRFCGAWTRLACRRHRAKPQLPGNLCPEQGLTERGCRRYVQANAAT